MTIHHRGFSCALAGLVFASAMGTAMAASDPNAFSLFNGIRKNPTGFFGVDLVPGSPEVEPIFVNLFSCTASTPEANGFISVNQKISIHARTSDGAVSAFKTVPPASVTSGLFPDPRVAQFQCGGVNEADYHTTYETLDPGSMRPANDGSRLCSHPFDPLELCFEFPHGPFIGLGIAEKNSTKVVIVGVGLKGVTEEPTEVDISRYSVTAYNMDGSRRWVKTIPQVSGGGSMFADWGLVGDLLAGDGNDEIRVVYLKEAGFRYVYYDVLTGLPIKTVDVSP